MNSLRWFLTIMLTAAVGACDSGTDPGDIDLSGTWSGTLTISTAAGDLSGQATLTIVQAGTSVAGSITLGDSESSVVDGSLSGSTLTITVTATQVTGDDCHLYPVTLVFDVDEAALTATSGGGDVCEGDGQGGHEPLEPVTGASGTLTRG